MLDAHLVECAHQGPLEEAPDAFNAVGVHVAHNPFLYGVIDCLVPSVVIRNAEVGLEFVSVDGFGFVLDSAVDEAMESVGASRPEYAQGGLARHAGQPRQ